MKKRIYISKPNDYEKLASVDYISKKALKVRDLNNGIILPAKAVVVEKGYFAGGVCTQNFEFVGGVERYEKSHKNFPGFGGMATSYQCSPSELYHSDESVIFGGGIYNHFGHFLLDGLSRLWYLIKNPNDMRKFAFVLISWDNKTTTSDMGGGG